VILVAGGTGRLGSILVDRLRARAKPVRILTRKPTDHEPPAGVEVAEGDVRDLESIKNAMRGVATVVSCVHGLLAPRGSSPAAVDRDGNANLIQAAQEAEADVVLMSVVGASADSPMELFRMKHAAETQLASSGIDYTVVRASAFLELWIELLQQTAEKSGRPIVFGHGNNPINFVSVKDVAAVLDHVLSDPASRGKTYDIVGPENLTMNQLAQAIQTSAGKSATPRHLPPSLLHLIENTVGRLNPTLGRQIRAVLAMDRENLANNTDNLRHAFPSIPATPLQALL
jgi:uncharacterized protein YbjT (DUF2867 family)